MVNVGTFWRFSIAHSVGVPVSVDVLVDVDILVVVLVTPLTVVLVDVLVDLDVLVVWLGLTRSHMPGMLEHLEPIGQPRSV
jgi:hypothetical protein